MNKNKKDHHLRIRVSQNQKDFMASEGGDSAFFNNAYNFVLKNWSMFEKFKKIQEDDRLRKNK